MKVHHQPTAQALARGLRFIPAGWNTFAGMLVVMLVHSILRFTSEELRLIAWSAFPAGVMGLTVFTFYRERNVRTLSEFLERAGKGDATPAAYERAFGIITNLPRQEVILGQSVWTGLAVPILAIIYTQTDTFSGSSALLVGLTAIALGAYVHIFVFFTLKRFLEPYRIFAAGGIPDPDRRESQVIGLSVNLKLALAVASLITGTTFFSVSMGQARLLRVVEDLSTNAQLTLLSQLQRDLSQAPDAVGQSLAARPIPADVGQAHFLIVSRETGEVIRGDTSALLPGEIRALLDTGLDSGDSLSFNTAHSFAWVPHPDGRNVLVSVSSKEALGVGMGQEGFFIILISLASVLTALAAARIISQDVVRSLAKMRERVSRIADGDLRVGEPFESEDDVGHLARGIDRMSSSLRSAISDVMSSADRVEGAAGEISGASNAVATTVEELGRSIRDVTNGMEAFSVQAEGIRSASLEFDQSVQHSSESVVKLSEAGGHLDESSELLAANIEQVTRSYEAMFHRIEEVSSSTEVLAQAADGTTAAMEEIATALQEVDSNAAQTSSLSDTVKESAEQGRVTVLETITGIGSIQTETELVAGLVGKLRDGTQEIGEIVGVIKNVADETGLLALNAAIIAAQAGDQGRSFAVVAGEIKALAQRVFANTKEITERITTVQDGAAEAVTAMARSSECVNAGVELAEAAGTSLETITSAANESRERMLQVLRAVRDQSGAATQIVGLMSEVRAGVDAIQEVGRHQTVATQEVLQSTGSMRGAAELVQSATGEQTHCGANIASDIQTIRQVSAEIASALDQQSTAVATALDLLARVHRDTASNGESNRATGVSAQTLIEEAATLREGVRRFKV